MSLITEIARTVANAQLVETEEVKCDNIIGGSVVAAQTQIANFEIASATVNEQWSSGPMVLPSQIVVNTASVIEPAVTLRGENTSAAAQSALSLTGTGQSGSGLLLSGTSGSGIGFNVVAANDTISNAPTIDMVSDASTSVAIDITGDATTSTGAGVRIDGTAAANRGVRFNTEVVAPGTGAAFSLTATSANGSSCEWVGTSTPANGMHGVFCTAGTGNDPSSFTIDGTSTGTGEGVFIEGVSTTNDAVLIDAGGGEIRLEGISSTARGTLISGTASASEGVVITATMDADTDPGVIVRGTVLDNTSALAPVFISGTTNGAGLSESLAENFGYTYGIVQPGDNDYTVDVQNQTGLCVVYDTPLTANRTVTLSNAAPVFGGSGHVIVLRQASGAFSLTIDAQGETIGGASVSVAGGVTAIAATSISSPGDPVTNANVHLMRSSVGWSVLGVAAEFS